jgi:LexA-binding, inner membrane-associated putative hydrolase
VIVCALAVVGVRFVLGFTFRRLTVHRGMFHSVPALVIAGLALFLLYDHLRFGTRLYLAGGVMIGFLSHLVLDELFAVDFQGGRVNNKFGTALKFFSPSFVANTFCYFVLFSLAILAWRN